MIGLPRLRLFVRDWVVLSTARALGGKATAEEAKAEVKLYGREIMEMLRSGELVDMGEFKHCGKCDQSCPGCAAKRLGILD